MKHEDRFGGERLTLLAARLSCLNSTSFLLITTLLLAPNAIAQTIYKCENADGVIEFTSEPCAENPEKIEIHIEAKEARPRAAHSSGPPVDPALLGQVFGKTPEEVIELIGVPAGTYIDDHVLSWLYPNACRSTEDGEECAEILFEDDQSFQITWLPRDTMEKSVRITQGFDGWRASGRVSEKPYTIADTNVEGLGKAEVVQRLGQPDVKKVFNGAEFWEYKKVPSGEGAEDLFVVYVEFDGDTVVKSVAN